MIESLMLCWLSYGNDRLREALHPRLLQNR
jgi:hypothetical protein